jgi:anti-sigma factor RsiW
MQRALTCREFVEFLADYLDGRLTADELDCFNRHLSACPSCVSYVRSYQTARRLGRGAFASPDDPVPEEVPASLVAAIVAARRSPS